MTIQHQDHSKIAQSGHTIFTEQASCVLWEVSAQPETFEIPSFKIFGAKWNVGGVGGGRVEKRKWSVDQSTQVRRQEPGWPDLAKFRHFVKIYKVLAIFLRVYLVLGKSLNLLWQNLFPIGRNLYTLVTRWLDYISIFGQL